MKSVLLVDADSKIPNLVLMKLSKYYKQKGWNVTLKRCNLSYFPSRKNKDVVVDTTGFDKVYCSVVFEGCFEHIITTGNTEVVFGGSGYDINIKLPDNIEGCHPDYSLYPENTKYAYGFISRGCIRNCYFCKVRQKEGYIKQVNNVDDILFEGRHVKFMDNNFLALKNHNEILSEIIDKKVRCQFNQGLDIRLIDKENSILLSKLNYDGEYIFAFDDIKDIDTMVEKLAILTWKKDWQFKFYVYVNPERDLSETFDRIDFLRENKCLPYVMRDISCWSDQYSNFYIDLAAYCNQPGFFKNLNFREYMIKRYPSKTSKRIEQSMSIWDRYNQN